MEPSRNTSWQPSALSGVPCRHKQYPLSCRHSYCTSTTRSSAPERSLISFCFFFLSLFAYTHLIADSGRVLEMNGLRQAGPTAQAIPCQRHRPPAPGRRRQCAASGRGEWRVAEQSHGCGWAGLRHARRHARRRGAFAPTHSVKELSPAAEAMHALIVITLEGGEQTGPANQMHSSSCKKKTKKVTPPRQWPLLHARSQLASAGQLPLHCRRGGRYLLPRPSLFLHTHTLFVSIPIPPTLQRDPPPSGRPALLRYHTEGRARTLGGAGVCPYAQSRRRERQLRPESKPGTEEQQLRAHPDGGTQAQARRGEKAERINHRRT